MSARGLVREHTRSSYILKISKRWPCVRVRTLHAAPDHASAHRPSVFVEAVQVLPAVPDADPSSQADLGLVLPPDRHRLLRTDVHEQMIVEAEAPSADKSAGVDWACLVHNHALRASPKRVAVANLDNRGI